MRECGLSQSEAQRFIAKGRLFVEGEPMCDASGEVEGRFSCVFFEPVSRGLEPIFQTNSFVLFDKPSGILVHPQNRYTPYSMIDEIRFHFGKHANIVHRIDQETSGLLLAAKSKQAERTLKMAFENREVHKRYLAFVRGKITNDMVIDEPLLRRKDESAFVRMIVKVDNSGKPSRTDIRVIEYFPTFDMTLVEAIPYTGRQHQIRVHLFHVKHPIVGDPLYAQPQEEAVRFLDREQTVEERILLTGASRLLLHAHRLDFRFEGVEYRLKSKEDFISEALRCVSRET